jgi:hypothetical protein
MHLFVIPDAQIQSLKAAWALFNVKEALLRLVFLVNVHGEDHGAGGDLRWLVVQEPGVVELELANLKRHIFNCFVFIVVQDAEEPLHGLHGSGEVEVKAQFDEDLRLQLNQGLLADILFLLVGQKIDHPGEARRDGLLELCRHQNTNGGERHHLRLGEVLWAHHVYVPVKDASSNEQCLLLVLLLHVKVEDLLDSVGAIVGGDLLINVLLLGKCFLNFLG